MTPEQIDYIERQAKLLRTMFHDLPPLPVPGEEDEGGGGEYLHVAEMLQGCASEIRRLNAEMEQRRAEAEMHDALMQSTLADAELERRRLREALEKIKRAGETFMVGVAYRLSYDIAREALALRPEPSGELNA